MVLGEVEVCPLDLARDQFEVMFWGPVHICKEVSKQRPTLKEYSSCFTTSPRRSRFFAR